MKLIDIAGQRFGLLSVLSKDSAPRMWSCLCDCGRTKLVAGSNLRNGTIRSCGCLAANWAKEMGSRPDFIAKRAASGARHGHKRRKRASPEYRIWLGMKRRCTDPKCKDFPNWGGRGIRVCAEWDSSFDAFLADMGLRPTPSHSIDRKDTSLGYTPGNCRWATPQQQGGENKRTNIRVAVDGVAFDSVAAACKHFGVGVSVAHHRIKAGIPADIAVSTRHRLPPRR